ncbi:MAG: outer membrane protein assembly factor BamA [candidate division Zixibacteria bacterium]
MRERLVLIPALIGLVILSGAVGTSAQNPGSSEGVVWQKTILSVEIEGVHSADTFLVLNSAGLIAGDILTPGSSQDAVKGVYGLGLFSDVELDVGLEEAGVRIIIRVDEFPNLKNLEFSGNKKIKRKKLEETLTLFEGRLVSPVEIKNNIERVMKLYAEKGYLLATVDIETSPVEGEENLVDLKLVIDEGKKVRIGGITFSGNKAFTDKKLRKKMSTKPKGFIRSGSFEKDKYLEDKDKVVAFYRERGFIDAVILGDSIWYSDDNTRMFIDIKINEGTKFYFGNLTWEGNTLIKDDDFSGNVKLKYGHIYNQKKYDETLFKFHELYQDQGYWYAQINEDTHARGDTIDFHWSITENNPVHIRLINIVGNTKTREKVIRRELVIKPNTIFKRSLLGRSLREVMILNFFANAVPEWDILPNGDIDLKIMVEEKPTGQFSVGAGYSARDKLIATVGLGVPNLFGTGQTATINVDLGKNRNTFDVSYMEPWLFDTPTSVSTNFYLQERNWYDWFTERRYGGGLQVGRRLRWPDNFFRAFWGYRLEEVNYLDISQDYKDDNVNVPYSVDKQSWPLTTSSANMTIIRDSRDLPQFPTSGSVISGRWELGGTILGGDWNFYKQTYTAEYYRKIIWKAVAMIKAKYGEIGGIYHGEDDIPYSERFAPGGVDPDGVIRGYDDGRLGPLGSYGGRFELIYNLEISISISDQQFYILFFADAGNVYAKMGDIDLFKGYYRSVGPGFRIIVPMIGIMGFDFGYAFDGFEKGKWKTHFQIGRGF